jgi:hypothetical protein
VIVEHDDGRLGGIEGTGGVVVEMEREPVDNLFDDPWLGLWATRYRLTLEFPEGFRFYTPARPPDTATERPALASRAALPPPERRETLR